MIEGLHSFAVRLSRWRKVFAPQTASAFTRESVSNILREIPHMTEDEQLELFQSFYAAGAMDNSRTHRCVNSS